VTFALRAERIRVLAPAEGPGVNAAAGTVEEVAYRGESSAWLVRLDGGLTLRVSRPNAEGGGGAPGRGARVTLAWEPAALVALRA
jgi:putrescine transport system ATP-binding protein